MTNFEVTRDTINIEVAPGVFVECLVVKDTVTEDGLVIEETFDFFAQNEDGSVAVFRRRRHEFSLQRERQTDRHRQCGRLAGGESMEPSPEIAHARPNPQAGDEYNQENAPGVALDHAEVMSLNGVPRRRPLCRGLPGLASGNQGNHPARTQRRWSTSSIFPAWGPWVLSTP